MPDTLPLPEKRKRATPKQINALLLSQNDACAHCKAPLVERGGDSFIRLLQPFDVDHVQRLDALGVQTLDNLACLCKGCHAVKTRTDNREAKKGRRIRGEAGQRARRETRGGSAIKSRGFDKTRTRGFDGKVRPREDFRISQDPLTGEPV